MPRRAAASMGRHHHEFSRVLLEYFVDSADDEVATESYVGLDFNIDDIQGLSAFGESGLGWSDVARRKCHRDEVHGGADLSVLTARHVSSPMMFFFGHRVADLDSDELRLAWRPPNLPAMR